MRRSDIEEIEYLLDEDPTEAVTLAKRITTETPQDADTWAWLADALMEVGDFEGALRALAEYVQRDPEWMEAYTLRAGLFTELGRFDAANIELEVARALDSEDPRLVRAEAMWHEFQGHFEEADRLYAQACETDPAYPPPARFDRARAKQAIQKVLRDVAKDGLKLQAVFEEMPTKASTGKALSRAVELRDRATVVVYLRNLERELDDESDLEDLAGLFEDRLADLVEAN